MKRLLILLVFISGFFHLNAQKSKVQSALNYIRYNELNKAIEAIEAAKDHEKTMAWAKTWFVRGQVYHAVFESQDSTVHNLTENPLKEATDSYLKCIELDEKTSTKLILFQD